ncbi:hypothetical protein QVD17_05818 [Tagetes erecta]|uniref:Uncharacterized protein n=1 Tax=Tagetes erecta TaxID=13708 RepID=A0AAD8LF05_TARER|nr:hypothetical protein QVD17_05818 [Tagetes erecta]
MSQAESSSLSNEISSEIRTEQSRAKYKSTAPTKFNPNPQLQSSHTSSKLALSLYNSTKSDAYTLSYLSFDSVSVRELDDVGC